MSDEYADFVLNATAAMEQRSKSTVMAGKLHFVSNVVLGPPDFAEPKLTAWQKLMRGTKHFGTRIINDHHEADGQGPNLGEFYPHSTDITNTAMNSKVLANFSRLLKSEGSAMKLIVGELDGFSNPDACAHCQLRALQTAAFLNLYQNMSDLIQAVCYVNAFERLQQEEQGSGWCVRSLCYQHLCAAVSHRQSTNNYVTVAGSCYVSHGW